MTDKEELCWRYMLANRHAAIDEIARECDVSEKFARDLIDRIASENWREEIQKSQKTVEQEFEDDAILATAAGAKSTRETILTTAKALTCGDRNKSYGPPHDNLSDCAALWEAYLNIKAACLVKHGDGYAVRITSEDVAWMMTLVKTARSFQSGMHIDNYIDAAAYSAIAGECREILEAEEK